MNKSKLKSYAPQARKDFIAAITARANQLGLSETNGILEIASGERKGDIAIIAGREWPAKVFEQRERLIKHIKTVGFTQTMDAVAYTWFNRVAALRYMEIHDYLDHGHRVLSNREGGMPEILNHATELELPGFNKDKAVELKLAGNKDGELYKMLLVAQCNALSNAMPFLFERIDDETELLLPDNLLRTDSIIAKLVEAIPEEDWQEVEIIGWLYQFYISEKKDEVIGKVVKSEDIPAATQLFTPNWIVQYLVQNSVGRLWLMANPASTLKSQWPYYIKPAEQTPEVQAQLDALIQTRMSEDGGSLNPETITVLDPACGSGHILVVAYDVLKAIYLERGYQLRAIPRLILEKNLYGLDIDDRAAQLAGFALLMKARADDRRLLDNPPKLNVLALQESKGLGTNEIVQALNTVRAELVEVQSIRQLIETFAHAKTFGSLIQISPELNAQLATMAEGLHQVIKSGDLYAQAAAQDLLPLMAQARVLGMQFDAVVANPPYMGAKFYDPILKEFIRKHLETAKGDLYTCFMVRNLIFTKAGGIIGMITIPNWMFLSTFEDLRKAIFEKSIIETFCHNGRGVFGSDFGSCAFTFRCCSIPEYIGSYKRLFEKQGSVSSNDELQQRFFSAAPYLSATERFRTIPGSPITYWLSTKVTNLFERHPTLGAAFSARQGLATTDNGRFVRFWYEVSLSRIGFGLASQQETVGSDIPWYPYNKGGEFRKWWGNQRFIVNWKNDGEQIKSSIIRKYSYLNGNPNFVAKNQKFYFKSSISFSKVGIGYPSFKLFPKGFIFDVAGSSIFADTVSQAYQLLSFTNTNISRTILAALAPSLNIEIEQINSLPISVKEKWTDLEEVVEALVEVAKCDWDNFETSWDFNQNPLIRLQGWTLPYVTINGDWCGKDLATSWNNWSNYCNSAFSLMKELEEKNNQIWIDEYDLGDEISNAIPDGEITHSLPNQTMDAQHLVSYAIGCMMGRYSLDEPGLIYAHAGNVGFDATRYLTFPPDADGIVPLTDELWFEDDAANRTREFLLAVWGAETLEENMAWLAESLGNRSDETPEETIRRYLAGSFFKDHLQTYKKRPIYWLFSSGKQGAFQALVYLHRYHEGTLARMRSEYVVPLTGKIQSRIEMLTKDAEAATVTSARNKINKEIETLRKKHVELLSYDEKLRHYADMRIKLDLDDGVKVNYGKFGDLLAEVKIVSGNNEE